MPESAPARGKEHALRERVVLNLGAVTLVFALLQCWRPCYCLTDDNLDANFPILASIGRRMLQGESPFLCPYLFGGHYDLLRDPATFFWHPIYLLAALLANTPYWYLTIDFVVYFFVAVGAIGFVCLADSLRTELGLKLSEGRLMLYTLSFSFSMIALCYAASWVNFLADYTAMPWLALGVLQTAWRRGLGMVSLFSVHDLLGGHPETAIMTALFSTLFAAGVAWWRRSYRPIFWWFGGYAIALVIVSPLLIPIFEGFAASNRAGGLTVGMMDRFAVPPQLFPFSLFFSVFSTRLQIPYVIGPCPIVYSCGIVGCAAAWGLIPALISRRPWTRLEMVCLALVVLAAVLAIRPVAISWVMVQVPLLKSMAWPFREVVQFQFFLHLFLVLRPMDSSAWFQRGLIWFGAFLYVVALPLLPAPTFNASEVDRELLLSGRAQNYWASVRTLLAPDDILVPVVRPDLAESGRQFQIPYTLINSGNYPALSQICSATGYSPTLPTSDYYLSTPITIFLGAYFPPQELSIIAERPTVRFLTLESLAPLKITLSSKSGAPLDVTPFLMPPSR